MASSMMREEEFAEMDSIVTNGFRIEGIDVYDPAALRQALLGLPKRIEKFASENEIDPEDLRRFLMQVVENSVETHEQA